jgi:HlyD family secretion protein
LSTEQSQSLRWFKRLIKLVLVGLISFTIYYFWPERKVPVRTVAVGRGEVTQTVNSMQAGVVKSNRQVNIRSISIGRIAKILVEKGDRVKEGQLLVELENTALIARLRLAKANLAAGVSGIRSAKLRRDVAKKALERSAALSDKGAVAPQMLERVQAEYDVGLETVTVAEANLAQLQAAIDMAMAALDDTRIVAPFDGLVVSVNVEKGEYLIVGAPVLELVDDSKMVIEAAVDEADAARIKVGMPVEVDCDAYPEKQILGSLTWISPVVVKDLRQNQHLGVEVSLNGAASLLKVGMSADIEVMVEKRENALNIPTSAIMRKATLEQVYVAVGGRAQLRAIRSGMSNWEKTEVVEGLREGERVIVSLEEKGLRDGAPIALSGEEGGERTAF